MQHQAAQINNYGVSCIRSGSLEEASKLFRRGLQLTQMQSELDSKTQQIAFGVVPPLDPSVPFSHIVGIPESLSYERLLDSNTGNPAKKCESGEDSIYLHHHGISLRLNGDYSPDPLLNTTIFSCIMIYNLGLTRQLQSSRNETAKASRSSYLQSSLSLYSKARQLLAGCSGGVQGIPELDVLVMALCNNSGYAAYQAGDYISSELYYHSLTEYVTASASLTCNNNCWDEQTQFIVHRFMHEFLLNAMVLQRPKLASAA